MFRTDSDRLCPCRRKATEKTVMSGKCFCGLGLAEFRLEPGSSEFPVAHDCFGRDCQHFGGFFHAESTEEAQLDHAGFALVYRSERVQCLVESDKFAGAPATEFGKFVEVHSFRVAAAFVSQPSSCTVEQDVPHNLRRHRKEVRPVLPVDVGYINQFQIGLMNEGRGLHRVPRTFVLELVSRDTPKGAINVWSEPVESSPIAIGPGTKKLRGLRWWIVARIGL